MQRIEIVVDGAVFETWVPDEAGAAALRAEVLAAAHAGSTVQVAVRAAQGDALVDQGVLVLRLGAATALALRQFPDDRTGAAMGVSR